MLLARHGGRWLDREKLRDEAGDRWIRDSKAKDGDAPRVVGGWPIGAGVGVSQETRPRREPRWRSSLKAFQVEKRTDRVLETGEPRSSDRKARAGRRRHVWLVMRLGARAEGLLVGKAAWVRGECLRWRGLWTEYVLVGLGLTGDASPTALGQAKSSAGPLSTGRCGCCCWLLLAAMRRVAGKRRALSAIPVQSILRIQQHAQGVVGWVERLARDSAVDRWGTPEFYFFFVTRGGDRGVRRISHARRQSISLLRSDAPVLVMKPSTMKPSVMK